MTLSFWQRKGRAPDVQCDVAVVGGGIVGCSTAYWLGQLRPQCRVSIVEAGALASGASGRNAGFLLQGTTANYVFDVEQHGPERAGRLWHFTRESRELVFAELQGEAFGLEASGSVTVAGSEAEDEQLRASAQHLHHAGEEVTYLPQSVLNRRLGAQGFLGALYVASGAVLDPAALVRCIAGQSGARVLEHHRVLSVMESSGQAVLETPIRRIRAGQVVLALNAYLPRLYPSLRPYVRPVRAQMLSTEAAPRRWLRLPAYTHEGHFYIRQTPKGHVLLGGARHLHRRGEVGYADRVTPALQADLEGYLGAHFPQAQGLQVLQRWSGVMGFSPDRVPSIGDVPGLSGSFWAAGFTGHGMAYGFRFGRLLAELIVGRAQPDGYDLFSAARFAGAQQKGL